MAENIPLINPELNYQHLELLEKMDTKFVKNPNCTSTIMSMPMVEVLRHDYKKLHCRHFRQSAVPDSPAFHICP